MSPPPEGDSDGTDSEDDGVEGVEGDPEEAVDGVEVPAGAGDSRLLSPKSNKSSQNDLLFSELDRGGAYEAGEDEEAELEALSLDGDRSTPKKLFHLDMKLGSKKLSRMPASPEVEPEDDPEVPALSAEGTEATGVEAAVAEAAAGWVAAA